MGFRILESPYKLLLLRIKHIYVVKSMLREFVIEAFANDIDLEIQLNCDVLRKR